MNRHKLITQTFRCRLYTLSDKGATTQRTMYAGVPDKAHAVRYLRWMREGAAKRRRKRKAARAARKRNR